ncbi:twin-arginine translocation signal domain-containing protein, partial [Candidatus Woesearchaeota archaeon]|nr:twin-arginine translocation signal domain-containing protein [Candidatus Woesearchaeota archaeon]MBT7926723.1 twin-arginine translocation signal domain-containing protein [Candidatus Woesearchaeota archaeon]
MGRRRFIKNTLAVIVGGGLLLAPSSVQAVGKGLETIAGEGE